jgi:hypothetical protein
VPPPSPAERFLAAYLVFASVYGVAVCIARPADIHGQPWLCGISQTDWFSSQISTQHGDDVAVTQVHPCRRPAVGSTGTASSVALLGLVAACLKEAVLHETYRERGRPYLRQTHGAGSLYSMPRLVAARMSNTPRCP